MRVAMVLVLLLLAGCGISPEPPPAPNPDPLPVPVTGPEPDLVTDDEEIEETLPKLPENPLPTEKVLHEIRVETVRHAAIIGKTSADCDGGKVITEPNAIMKCHVTYDNVTVPWQVNADSGADAGFAVFYVTAPLRACCSPAPFTASSGTATRRATGTCGAVTSRRSRSSNSARTPATSANTPSVGRTDLSCVRT